MSFSLNLAKLPAEQIAFGFSAAHETLMALHVFYDCKHHPLHIPWVIQARRLLSPGLKEEIEAFSIFYKRPIITFWDTEENSPFQSFDTDLNILKNIPTLDIQKKVFHSILKREVAGPMDHKTVEEVLGHTEEKSKKVISQLIENPTENRERFLQLLDSFWKACLKEEWPRIEELLVKDIAFRGRKLLEDGPMQMLEGLSSEIDIVPGETRAVIRRISKAEFILEEKDSLFLKPSYFIWPHLFVKRDKPVGINYPIMENQNEGRRPIPPDRVLKFFRAMGDVTRLQIVQYLAQKPRSTRDLAVLIGVTEGAVSKHLKQLQDAGVLTSKRESYYVFYKLEEKLFHDFSPKFLHFLKQQSKGK